MQNLREGKSSDGSLVKISISRFLDWVERLDTCANRRTRSLEFLGATDTGNIKSHSVHEFVSLTLYIQLYKILL